MVFPVSYSPLHFQPDAFGQKYGDTTLDAYNLAVLDADGDGSQEILFALTSYLFTPGNPEGTAHVAMVGWQNGEVVDLTNARMPDVGYYIVRDLYVADMNGDGLDDIFVSTHGPEIPPEQGAVPGEQNGLLLSNGDGTYRDATSNLPQFMDFGHSAVLADFDDDGDIDILSNDLGAGDPGNYQGLHLLTNDGSGTFSFEGRWLDEDDPDAVFGDETRDYLTPYRITEADLGADGVPDAYLHLIYHDFDTQLGGQVAGNAFAVGDGSNTFDLQFVEGLEDPQLAPPHGMFTDLLFSTDIDLDGDLDIIVTYQFISGWEDRLGLSGATYQEGSFYQILRNDGAAGYVNASDQLDGQAGGALLPTVQGFNAKAVDLDGDGDPDLIDPNWDTNWTEVQRWWENDGNGNFTALPPPAEAVFNPFSAVPDVNGDWLPDVVTLLPRWKIPELGVNYGDPGFEIRHLTWRLAEMTQAVTYVGNEIADRLAGGTEADRLSGVEGDDSLNGNAGHDTVIGGAGGDHLEGRLGDDILLGGERGLYGTEISGQIYRLFNAVFGREPNWTGHQNWAFNLASDAWTLDTVSDAFGASAEFQITYGMLSNTDFVTQLFRNVLGRDPAQAGVTGWVGNIENGMSRAEVVRRISESAEHKVLTREGLAAFEETSDPTAWADDVFRLFRAIFDRDPGEAGFTGWIKNLTDGAFDFAGVVSQFMASQEFQLIYGDTTNEEFVLLMFQNVYGREPAQAGLDGWTANLDGGMTREEMVEIFVNTPEFLILTGAALEAYIAGYGADDRLEPGAGNDVISGGLFSDTFVFTADGMASEVTVTDLEPWDVLDFSDFGLTKEQVLANIGQNGSDAVYDDGTEVIRFPGIESAGIDLGMTLV